MEKEIEVIVQHFHGCPNGPKMIDSVKKAVQGLEDRIDFSDIIIDSEKKAAENDFRGSPTLLIAGEDYEDLDIPEKPGLTCRFYPDGLPDSESIRKKILDKLQR